MFGGLEVKAPATHQEQDQQPQQQQQLTSGFSFMSSASGTNNEKEEPPVVAQPPTTTTTTSGFSFMSNSAVNNKSSEAGDNNTNVAMNMNMNNNNNNSSIGITGENKIMENNNNLGLSELLSLGPMQNDNYNALSSSIPNNEDEKEPGFTFLKVEKEDIASSSEVVGASANQQQQTSGFSFMSSVVNEKEEPSVVSQPPTTGFSFMSNTANNNIPPTNEVNTVSSSAPITAPSPALSSFNNTQQHISPAITAKKNIKKKRRGKKIGFGTHETTTTSTTAVAVTAEAQYVPPGANNTANIPSSTSELSLTEKEDSKQKSLEANERANQFLSEKLKEQQQRPSSVVIDYATDPTQKSPTVAQAVAAAEEAKAMINSGSNGSGTQSRLSEGVSGFFAKTRKTFSFKKPDEKEKTSTPHSSQWTSGSVHSYNSSLSDQSSSQPQQYHSNMKNYDEDDEDDDDASDAKAIAIAEEKRLQKLRHDAEEIERKALEKQRRAKMKEDELQKLEEDNLRKEEERIKNMTPKEKFEVIINEFRIEIDTLMTIVTKLRKQRKELNTEKQETTQKDKLASQFLSQTYQKQTNAIDNEDFDLADHLTSIINQKTQQKKELTEILYQLKEASNELECNETNALKRIIQSFCDIQIKMEEFYEIEDKQEKGDSTDQLEKFGEIFKRLSAEQDRLNNEWKHIERDEGLVKEEREQLEDVINDETKDIDAERSITNDKLSSVKDEIECLKEQLAIKEAEETILQNELGNHDTEIEKIRSKFHRQLSRLSKKETSISDNRYDWETEKEAMTLTREKHDAEVTAHSEALLAYENLMKGVKSEIQVVGRWKGIINNEIKIALKSDGEDDEEEEELLALTSDLVKFQAAVEDAEDIVNAAQHALDNLYKEKESIETSIPILENEKKTAAAKRDFKSASKASKEMKEAILKLKQCEEEIEIKATGCLEDALAEKERLIDELKLKQSLVLEKQRSQAVNKMTQLGSHIRILEQFKEEFNTTKDEDANDDESSSNNNNDASCSISSVGVNILEKEILALTTEGELLGAEFGGWEEILQAVDNDNNDVPDNKADNDVNSTEDEQPDDTSTTTHDTKEPNEIKEEEESVDNDATAEKEEKTKEEIQEELNQLQEQLIEFENKLEEAVEEEDFDAAAEIDDSINQIKIEMDGLENKLK